MVNVGRRIRAILYPGPTPTPHIQQERTARFPAQPLSALLCSLRQAWGFEKINMLSQGYELIHQPQVL